LVRKSLTTVQFSGIPRKCKKGDKEMREIRG
jgi:hypothetical protein